VFVEFARGTEEVNESVAAADRLSSSSSIGGGSASRKERLRLRAKQREQQMNERNLAAQRMLHAQMQGQLLVPGAAAAGSAAFSSLSAVEPRPMSAADAAALAAFVCAEYNDDLVAFLRSALFGAGGTSGTGFGSGTGTGAVSGSEGKQPVQQPGGAGGGVAQVSAHVSAASEARLAALAAAFDAEMVDLRALALLGADGWRTPNRYQVW
jgi:hypothetical protein